MKDSENNENIAAGLGEERREQKHEENREENTEWKGELPPYHEVILYDVSHLREGNNKIYGRVCPASQRPVKVRKVVNPDGTMFYNCIDRCGCVREICKYKPESRNPAFKW